MTVLKLTDLISKVPYKEVKFPKLRGLRVAIDANWVLHYATKSTRGFRSKDGKCTSHYRTVIGISQQLGFSNVCWVFDGVANSAKTAELERREAAKSAAESKTVENFTGDYDSDEDFIDKIENNNMESQFRNQDRIRLADNVIPDTKRILDILNVSWLDAPDGFEAECVASWMTQNGIADAVYSKDADCFALGAQMIIVPQKGNGETSKFSLYMIDDVYSFIKRKTGSEIPGDQILKIICMALGTDWDRSGIRNIGPKTILKKWNSVLEQYESDKYEHLRELCKTGYELNASQERILTSVVARITALGTEGHDKPTWDLDESSREALIKFLREGTFVEKTINSILKKITTVNKKWKPSKEKFRPLSEREMDKFLQET